MQGSLEVAFSIALPRDMHMAHRYSLLFDSNLLTHRIGLWLFLFYYNRPTPLPKRLTVLLETLR